MSYRDNLYYYPENNGLRIVSSADAGECYEFDIVAVFQDVESGELFIGSDSGCSCPTPFEDMTRDDLEPIKTKAEVVEYVRGRYGWNDEEVADLVSGW